MRTGAELQGCGHKKKRKPSDGRLNRESGRPRLPAGREAHGSAITVLGQIMNASSGSVRPASGRLSGAWRRYQTVSI
jgi:hypothetical protein